MNCRRKLLEREVPGEMDIEYHRLPGLRSEDSLAAGRAAAHQVHGRQHSTLAQQLDPPLLHPGTFPGSLGQI
jgi:hypothetical protein